MNVFKKCLPLTRIKVTKMFNFSFWSWRPRTSHERQSAPSTEPSLLKFWTCSSQMNSFYSIFSLSSKSLLLSTFKGHYWIAYVLYSRNIFNGIFLPFKVWSMLFKMLATRYPSKLKSIVTDKTPENNWPWPKYLILNWVFQSKPKKTLWVSFGQCPPRLPPH